MKSQIDIKSIYHYHYEQIFTYTTKAQQTAGADMTVGY